MEWKGVYITFQFGSVRPSCQSRRRALRHGPMRSTEIEGELANFPIRLQVRVSRAEDNRGRQYRSLSLYLISFGNFNDIISMRIARKKVESFQIIC